MFTLQYSIIIPKMASYQLRRERKSYKDFENIRLPQARRVWNIKEDELYELEVLEENESTGEVRVHYIGYDSSHDEWRDKNDIQVIKSATPGTCTKKDCTITYTSSIVDLTINNKYCTTTCTSCIVA